MSRRAKLPHGFTVVEAFSWQCPPLFPWIFRCALATWHAVCSNDFAMTESNSNPTPAGDRKMLRWILVLQIVILAWLARNHLDGAFSRRSHNQPTAVATQPDTPPSLEPSAQLNAPSSFFALPRLPGFQRTPPPRYRHPADRIRGEMERMMADAQQAFADFDSAWGMDDAWAALPASPVMNMREMADAYELSLAMPDANPDSFDVRLDGRLVSITSHQDTRTPRTTSSQHYNSRLLLPGPVEPDATLQITHDSGRIRIRIPKPAAAPAGTATASR
jgi:HSP20 family protein